MLAIEQENTIFKDELISERRDLKKTIASLEERKEELAKITNRNAETNSENKLLKENLNSADFIICVDRNMTNTY